MMRSSRGSASSSDRTLLDRTFVVSLVLKGLNGVLELVAGVLLLLLGPAQIGALVAALTQHELSEDPHDIIASAFVRLAEGLNLSATLFLAVYLLLHGVVKVVLIWAVLPDRLWAYPWLIGFLTAFIVYQCYELVVAFGWGLLALTALDIVVVALTRREYSLQRARRREAVEDASDPVP